MRYLNLNLYISAVTKFVCPQPIFQDRIGCGFRSGSVRDYARHLEICEVVNPSGFSWVCQFRKSDGSICNAKNLKNLRTAYRHFHRTSKLTEKSWQSTIEDANEHEKAGICKTFPFYPLIQMRTDEK